MLITILSQKSDSINTPMQTICVFVQFVFLSNHFYIKCLRNYFQNLKIYITKAVSVTLPLSKKF